jgi:hypothetical protein
MFQLKAEKWFMKTLTNDIYRFRFNRGLPAELKAPAVERSKATPYYNIGSLSISQPRGFESAGRCPD